MCYKTIRVVVIVVLKDIWKFLYDVLSTHGAGCDKIIYDLQHKISCDLFLRFADAKLLVVLCGFFIDWFFILGNILHAHRTAASN